MLIAWVCLESIFQKDRKGSSGDRMEGKGRGEGLLSMGAGAMDEWRERGGLTTYDKQIQHKLTV